MRLIARLTTQPTLVRLQGKQGMHAGQSVSMYTGVCMPYMCVCACTLCTTAGLQDKRGMHACLSACMYVGVCVRVFGYAHCV